MRVEIAEGEEWPVYSISETDKEIRPKNYDDWCESAPVVEISPELMARYQAAAREWEEVQSILHRLSEGGSE